MKIFILLLCCLVMAHSSLMDDIKGVAADMLDRMDVSGLAETGANILALKDKGSAIWKDVERYKSKDVADLCDTTTCCQMGGSEQCSLSSMKQGESTMVLAPEGSPASCLYGTPYGFQVVPGSSENLLFYFQGGGACWDRASTIAGMCSTDLAPNAPTGVFDKTNDQNPFQDFTIVHVLYCSGDVHSGNVTQPYKKAGKPVVQHGIDNVQLVTSWLSQQGMGGDDGVMDKFVIMGCSAGSVGAQMWASVLLNQFPATQTAVVPDSYAGLFPADSMGRYMKSFGICESNLVSPEIKPSCEAGNLDIQRLVSSHIRENPNTPFAYIQSKVDAVQQSFYIAIGLTTSGVSPYLTPSLFYSGINGIFTGYNKMDNFLTYLVDGPMHCFTNFNIMYSTTNEGPYGKRGPPDQPAQEGDLSLREWLEQVPLAQGEKMTTECAGESEMPPPYPTLKGTEVPRYSYCDPEVSPKSYTQA